MLGNEIGKEYSKFLIGVGKIRRLPIEKQASNFYPK